MEEAVYVCLFVAGSRPEHRTWCGEMMLFDVVCCLLSTRPDLGTRFVCCETGDEDLDDVDEKTTRFDLFLIFGGFEVLFFFFFFSGRRRISCVRQEGAREATYFFFVFFVLAMFIRRLCCWWIAGAPDLPQLLCNPVLADASREVFVGGACRWDWRCLTVVGSHGRTF